MNFRRFSALAGFALGGCGSIVHTPPRTSVEVALARKPEVIRLAESGHPEPRLTSYRSVFVPPIEPELPTNTGVEMVAEAFTRGKTAMDAGKVGEAIQAFEEATKIEPEFADAWQALAQAYEQAGQAAKAKEAFQRSTNLAKH